MNRTNKRTAEGKRELRVRKLAFTVFYIKKIYSILVDINFAAVFKDFTGKRREKLSNCF